MTDNTKQCPKCHTENPIEASFCRHCRHQFSDASKKGLSVAPIIKNIYVRETEYCEGSKIHIEWDVENATSLNLSGKDVSNTESCEYKVNRVKNLKLTAENEYTVTVKELHLNPKEAARIRSFKSDKLVFDVGDVITFSWETFNAKRVIILSEGNEIDVTTKTSVSFNPTGSTELRLVAYSVDEKIFAEESIAISLKPQINELKVVDSDYCEGSTIRVEWDVDNVETLSLNGVDVSGRSSYNYEISNNNHTINLVAKSGNVTVSKELHLKPSSCAKVLNFRSSNDTITSGQHVKLKWSVKDAHHVLLKSGGVDLNVTNQEEITLNPTKTTEYTLVAYSIDENVRDEKSIKVTVVSEVEIESFTIDKSSIAETMPIVLSWNVQNADRIELLPLYQDVTGRNSITLYPKSNTEYRLIASNRISQKEAYVSVGVLALPKIDVKIADSLSAINLPDLAIDLTSSLGSMKETGIDRWMSSHETSDVSNSIWDNRAFKKLRKLLSKRLG